MSGGFYWQSNMITFYKLSSNEKATIDKAHQQKGQARLPQSKYNDETKSFCILAVFFISCSNESTIDSNQNQPTINLKEE